MITFSAQDRIDDVRDRARGVELACASICRECQTSASVGRAATREGLLTRDEDAGDIHMPFLLWWAIEVHCEKNRDQVLRMFRDSTLWRAKIVEESILSRLMKRFAMAGSQKDYQTCIELFRLAPEKSHGKILLKGFEEAFKGRSIAGLPDELIAEIEKLGGGSIAFGVRRGNNDASEKAMASIQNPKTPLSDRLELIDLFGEARQPRFVDPLLNVLTGKEPDAVKKTALGSLRIQGRQDRRRRREAAAESDG